ncbi:MAG: heme-copper oxidase subunit III [Candidatus Promineifilaceae bacterium]
MSMVSTTPHEHHDGEPHGHEVPWPVQLRSNRLGMWLFIFSEVFLFGALLTARFVLWGEHRPELSQEMGLMATVTLLVSSWFVYRGQTSMEFGDRKKFQTNFLLASLFGLMFLVGVVFFEWNVFGLQANVAGIELFGHLKPSDGVESGIFFAMTGWHALHVVTGLMLLLIMWNKGRRGEFTPERSWGVEGAGLYWHFVDVVWVFYYPALYLMGTPF